MLFANDSFTFSFPICLIAMASIFKAVLNKCVNVRVCVCVCVKYLTTITKIRTEINKNHHEKGRASKLEVSKLKVHA